MQMYLFDFLYDQLMVSIPEKLHVGIFLIVRHTSEIFTINGHNNSAPLILSCDCKVVI